MSAFLGPIHIWLFKKIKFQEALNQKLVIFAKEKDIDISLLDEFGVIEEGELADLIDDMNIHGWLQERVTRVELRFSYLVDSILKAEKEYEKDIKDIAYHLGKENQISDVQTPNQAYNALDTFLLNGMPCDRVLNIVDSNENLLSWTYTADIHEQYWENFDRDTEVYYAIRDALIAGLLEGSRVLYSVESGIYTLSV